MASRYHKTWREEVEAAPDVTCNLKKGTACPAMRTYMQHDRKKGINLVRFHDLETGRHTRTAFVYQGSPADAGIEFNVCPWCRCELGD